VFTIIESRDFIHVSVNLVFYNITIVLSGILIEKCSFEASCQFNAKPGAIDLMVTPGLFVHACEAMTGQKVGVDESRQRISQAPSALSGGCGAYSTAEIVTDNDEQIARGVVRNCYQDNKR